MQNIIEKFNNAVQLEKEGQYLLALDEYNSVVNENDRFREGYLNLGSLYSRMNRLDDAINCYKKALSLGADHLIYFNLGSVYYKKGNYKKAIINLDRSRRLKREFPLSTLVMGLSFSRLNNTKAAEICFRDVILISPDNTIALTALSIIYFDSGRHKESLVLVDRILVCDPKNQSIRRLRARILFQLNKVNEFANEIKHIKKSSKDFKMFDEFISSVPVDIYTDRFGSIDDKITRLRERSKDKSKTDSLISLSLCHLLKGDTDIAIDYLVEARKRAMN
jgi:tetratricopeptide (TPR) repeat protein